MPPLIIDLQGPTLTPEEKDLIKHPFVGGIILFTRNYQNPDQLKKLTTEIKETKDPILICIDQEGGRVQRLQKGFTQIPPMGDLGKLYEQNQKEALEKAQQTGHLLASELIAHGIDLSFTPVIDKNKGQNTVIGNRAFHQDPAIIVDLAKALITGLNQAGMTACLKHFPGHGTVKEDSHHALPIDDRDYEEIAKDDMEPFTQLLDLPNITVMMAHIAYPKIDNLPASYSKYWIQKILRKKLNFKGTIFSDDLSMEGAKIYPTPTERVEQSLKAGCDKILICNDQNAVKTVLNNPPTLNNAPVGANPCVRPSQTPLNS